ncbi:MAG: 23S rRNA (adenine(2503)-C(2))-methyltransferase RlmN [Patescibacteria group bacterium]|jgi:23S rRNA (adenine2503-C2)-methyltransferase
MNLDKLNLLLQEQKPYRIKQAKKAIYQEFISDWEQATTLPLDLRQRLQAVCSLEIKATEKISVGGQTIKALIKLDDVVNIETVLMRHNDGRNTVCVSSQAGCPVGCIFCATGAMGFQRNLNATEIIEQVIYFARILKANNEKVTNVVFMGMGEPFLNYENVIAAIRILNDPEAFNLGARKISVSTSGIVPGIEKFAKENFQVNLAISLHAPNDKLRSRLMPINETYSIEDLLSAVNKYLQNNPRRVMFEYLMISGINDSEKCARELAELLSHPLYLVNLIKYNKTSGKYQSSDNKTISQFMGVLLAAGIPTTQRFSFGHEINAACGQLAGQR